ncbi:MAG: BMP family ABC transporter substrate-binding protein [Nitrososphaerales archaeon]|nr:BMP family ABC transporter substrate-binding protein [Nitrososphaerales archaeon]
MRIENRRGISSTISAAIIIIIVVVAGVGYYYYYTTTSVPPAKTKLTIGVVYDTGGKGDKSFNDMAYAGILNANKTLGVNYIELGSTSANDYVPNIETLVAKHVNLVVAVGFLMDQAIASEAAKYPNVYFTQVDGDIYNMTNVVAVKFQENVGSALVGALAVAMTKTDKIGFIGGMDIGLIHKFWHGYQFGAQWASTYLNKPVAVLPAAYTGTTPAAWNAPDIAKSEATAMFAQGADIIYAAAGASGTGLFDQTGALNQATSWNWNVNTPPQYMAIGVDADQDYYGTYQYFVQHNTNASQFKAPSFVLTSEMKRVDVAVFTVAKSVVNDNFSNFWNNPTQWGASYFNGQTQACGNTGDQPCHVRGVFVMGLAQHAVGPSQMTYTSQYMTPDAKRVLTQLTNGILNGTITVPENYAP